MAIDLKRLQERFDKFFAEEDHETFEKWLEQKVAGSQSPSVSAEAMTAICRTALTVANAGLTDQQKDTIAEFITEKLQEYKQTSDLAGKTVYVPCEFSEAEIFAGTEAGPLPLKPITVGETGREDGV